MKRGWLYILKCADGSYYTGTTSDIQKRISEHQLGLYNCYTKNRRPVKLVYSQEFSDIRYAILSERQIKGWSRKKKESLIKGNFNILHELSQCKNKTNYKNFK